MTAEPRTNGSGAPARKKRTSRELYAQLSVCGALALLIILLTQDILFRTPLRSLENSALDLRFQYRGPLPVSRDSLKVIMLDINEASIKSLPHAYPWPRSYYAHVIRNLKRAGVRGIGIDVIFDQPDVDSASNDADLINAIRQTGIVAVAGKTEIAEGQYVTKEQNYGNIFYNADSSIGIAYVPSDEEGELRRYQPMTYDNFEHRFVPSLAFATLDKAYGLPARTSPENTPRYFAYNGIDIPKFDNSDMLVNYYGPDATFKHVPFADVLDDSSFKTTDEIETGAEINLFDDPDIGYLQSAFFKDKIILIGSTMPEEKDLFTVPIGQGLKAGDNTMYGVEVHANIIEDVLDHNFLYREPQWVDILAILIILTGTLLGITEIKRLKLPYHAMNEILGVILVLAEFALIVYGSARLFVSFNYVTIVGSPSLAVIAGYSGATIYNYLIERKQKAIIKGMFTQYLNPTVVDQLVDNPDKLRLGGERKELTIFFSDIEGFTSISEKLQPEGLVHLLNEYLSEMTAIIFEYEGTLDKFEGDAVMAFWGAPVDQGDHALRACKASLKMLESLAVMREQWKSEGKPPLNIRIGLNTGEVLVGNMGGAGRFDYTVIGDSVNLASRLESANKQYHSRIMLGQKTFVRVAEHVVARELDKLVVVGKTEPVTVYELLGMSENALPPQMQKFLDAYNEGLRLYRERQWEPAIEHFEKARKFKAEDYPSEIYIERARMYQMSPPPDDWNGVFILRSK